MEITLESLLEALPETGDGYPIVPGITVFCIVGKYIDEREVIGPFGEKALLTDEPTQHFQAGICTGSAHRLAYTVFSTREAAEHARLNDRAIMELVKGDKG